MIVKIPNNYLPERQYIVNVLLKEFLGLDFVVETHNTQDYQIITNNKSLIIKDYFFSKHTENTYLNKKNIPNKIEFLEKNDFTKDLKIPVIFGKPQIKIGNNEIICEIDFFASSFFMLSRWEEYVNTVKDKNGRFSEKESLSIKNDFNNRAIVNEYAEILWQMLNFIGIKQQRKIRKYNLMLTHDVDFFRRFTSYKKFAKTLAGDLLKRKSTSLAKDSFSRFKKYKQKKANDPFDTFDYLMNISEKYNVKSHFYFIPGKIGEADASYNINNPEVVETIKKIKARNHIVGAHFGWNSFDNFTQLKTEKNRLERIITNIEESRQHFLRFDVPKTWQLLEKTGIKKDSSMGYYSETGFRCGTCYEFPIFDILQRKTLNIKELPLIAMDTAIAKKTKRNKEKFISELENLSKIVKKYSGNFVFLWHQNNLGLPEWNFINDDYEEIIKKII